MKWDVMAMAVVAGICEGKILITNQHRKHKKILSV